MKDQSSLPQDSTQLVALAHKLFTDYRLLIKDEQSEYFFQRHQMRS
jgi:hypothetical protein